MEVYGYEIGPEANLEGANLERAILRWADLTGANLIGADLRQADLSAADLTQADLTGAEAIWGYGKHVTYWPEGFDPVAAGVTFE